MGKKQMATFRLDALLFGIEVERVQEVIRAQTPTLVPLAPAAVAGLLNLRGQIVTAIDLRRALGLGPRIRDADSMNVVVRSADEVVGLVVDEIGDVVEVTDEWFEVPPETLTRQGSELVRGVYKLNGVLLLVLDTDAVIARAA